MHGGAPYGAAPYGALPEDMPVPDVGTGDFANETVAAHTLLSYTGGAATGTWAAATMYATVCATLEGTLMAFTLDSIGGLGLFAAVPAWGLQATTSPEPTGSAAITDTTPAMAAASGAQAGGLLFATELSAQGTANDTGALSATWPTPTLSSTTIWGYTMGLHANAAAPTLASLTAARLSATPDRPVLGGVGTAELYGHLFVPAPCPPTPTMLAYGTLDQTASLAAGFLSLSATNTRFAATAYTPEMQAHGTAAVALTHAYVLNVTTTESTRYIGYPFRHIVRVGGKPYGVTATGLRPLDAQDDGGTPIAAHIVTKDYDFGSFHSKFIDTMWVNTDQPVTVTPTLSGSVKPAYPSTFGGRKVVISRGLADRYWQFRIDNITKLEGYDILPREAQRRIK